MELTPNNYYSQEANTAYWSASFIKAMLECPAMALAELRGEWTRPDSTALLVGSYVDAYFEGTLDSFKTEHPQIYKRDGSLKSEYIKADEMISRAASDSVFMGFMQGEKQKIVTGEIFGFPFKAKFDVYDGQRIVDLKTAKDMKPIYKAGQGRLSFADAWHWTLQMAIYQRLEGHNLPCYLAVITKEEPPDIEIVEIPQSVMDTEMQVLEQQITYFDAMKQGIIEPDRCGKCACCRATKKLTAPKSLELFTEEIL